MPAEEGGSVMRAARRVAMSVAVLLATAFVAAPAQAQTTLPVQPAQTTKSFVESIGVNLHLNYNGTPYTNFEQVKAKLVQLGVRSTRDGLCGGCLTQHDRINALAAAGIKSQLMMGGPADPPGTIDQLVDVAEAKLGTSVLAFEGSNEYDLKASSDPNWIANIRNHQQALHTRLEQSPKLRNVQLLGPSIAWGSNRKRVGDLTPWLDVGNFHPYPGGKAPGWNIDTEKGYSSANSGTRPLVASETGYHNYLANGSTHPAVSEKASGAYIPRLYLEYFLRGIPRSYVYELVNRRPALIANSRDDHFGLLRNDFSEKPAYTNLRNLIGSIGDQGVAATPPQGLRYALGGDTTGVRQLLLQRADGTWILALWQNATVYDLTLKKDLELTPKRVTVDLGQAVGAARVYDVGRSASPLETRSRPTSVPVSVGAHPVVVQLDPAPPPGLAVEGLRGEYFDRGDLTDLRFTRVDRTVDFSWAAGSPSPLIAPDTFSVRWTGQVQPKYSEIYTFRTSSDNGVRLYVNGRLLVNRWRSGSWTGPNGSIALLAGQKVDIKLEFFENTGAAYSKLSWSSPRTPVEVVPASALSTVP